MTENDVLLSIVEDKMLKCSNNYVVTCSNFLDVNQQSIVEAARLNINEVNRVFYGGYDTAERNTAVFLPSCFGIADFDALVDYFRENPKENPLSVLRLKKDSFSTASHRDYLGALMGLGLKREMIGDIIVTENGADIIVTTQVVPFIKSELKSVGRATVNVAEIDFYQLSDALTNITEETVNVSSMRIDNIVSACFRLSRSESASAILSGNVYVNSLQVLKCDKRIEVGDKLVFRSKGKVVLKEISGVSKKGRNFLKIDVYR